MKKVFFRSSIRADKDALRLSGYAVKWRDTAQVDGMAEQIKRGAFDLESEKVFFLINHDSSLPLGKSGRNMELSEDDTGLRFKIDLPDTPRAKELYSLAKAGIIDGMSVGMSDLQTEESGGMRIIHKARLQEISATQAPAYRDTSLEARNAKGNQIIYPPECF